MELKGTRGRKDNGRNVGARLLLTWNPLGEGKSSTVKTYSPICYENLSF